MQAETEGNEFASPMPQSESSQNLSKVAGQENAAQLSEQQRRAHVHQEKSPSQLSDQESLTQLPNEGCLPQVTSMGGPSQLHGQESLREIPSQDALHNMARQEHSHQVSTPEVITNMAIPQSLSNVPSSHINEMQDSQNVIDIAAPEMRTRIRSPEEEIVVLQSTFTQTLPIPPEESKKVCHSVAVQTQFNTDYEPQAYSVITEDSGVSYDSDGVRVLRAIGTWTPNYQANGQFGEPNSEVYLNGSATVSSPENSMVQHSVSSSPNSAANCMTSAATNRDMNSDHTQALHDSLQDSLHDDQDPNEANKQAAGDKAFVCPVCSKGLARKDKLVIHMRIHTGEKPYVCEVCERAFARRDKLVMHMNKLKHITPTNIAPLGKRQHHHSASGLSMLPEKRHDMKLESQEMGSPASSVDIQPATLVQVVHEQPTMTWNCELCGRICMSREEWTAHARSHLDGDTNFGTASVSSSLSVLTPLASYQYSAAPPDRHTCVVCRQDFPSKTDLILHLRTHFVGKPELLANHVASLADPSGVC